MVSFEEPRSPERSPWASCSAAFHLALGCVALGVCACGPTVRWRARSPDLRHVLEVVAASGGDDVMLDGAPRGHFDEVERGGVVFSADGAAHFAARVGAEWRVVGPAGPGPSFLEVELPVRVIGGAALYSAADSEGWRVVRGLEPGAPFEAATSDLLVAPDGGLVYVGRSATSERVVSRGALGPPFEDVHLLALGGISGEHVVYAGRLAGEDHLVVGTEVGSALEEVLELVAARAAPAHAVIVGVGEHCELVHAPAALGGGSAAPVTLGSAPLLSHLRISDDGAHVACLSPAPDGLSIEVWLDGAVVARHRRVEGELLSFVPGEARLVWLAEDAQGLVVHVDETASERFESVEGPQVVERRVGFVGRRGGRSEVWVDGERLAEEPYATALRLGEGRHFAFVARTTTERFVVTRRGRWPVPRFFVDTLVLDPTGEHWAALVPDAAERRFAVWIDGEAAADVAMEEVLGPAVAAGRDPTEVLVEMVEAVLRATLTSAAPSG